MSSCWRTLEDTWWCWLLQPPSSANWPCSRSILVFKPIRYYLLCYLLFTHNSRDSSPPSVTSGCYLWRNTSQSSRIPLFVLFHGHFRLASLAFPFHADGKISLISTRWFSSNDLQTVCGTWFCYYDIYVHSEHARTKENREATKIDANAKLTPEAL